jgi:hypothetical protein
MNECDWLDEIATDLKGLAVEIREASRTGVLASRTLSDAVRARSFPTEALLTIEGLPKKTDLASALSKDVTAIDQQSSALLAALERMIGGLQDLKRCCAGQDETVG